MNKKHGILIVPESHWIGDVEAYIWDGHEIRQKLQSGDKGFVLRELATVDKIALDEFLNFTSAGKASRSIGFELFGEQYFGNALIIPGSETKLFPHVTSREVSRAIRFFSANDPLPSHQRGPSELERFAGRA